MKNNKIRIIIAILLFIIGFTISYIILSLHYESEMIWALEVSARQRLISCIKYKALIKIIISLIVGIITGSIPIVVKFGGSKER